MKTVAIFVFTYLLGSVPFGLLAGLFCRGVDIRKYGSGNIGATNVLRAIGRGPAAVVSVLDILKGFLPVFLAKQLMPGSPWLLVGVAMVAILGHTFSVFLKFRGGKGAATSLGVIIGLDYRAAAVTFVVWFLVVAITRYVSLASIAGAIAVPTSMFAFHLPMSYRIFGLIACACVVAKHRSNIGRLLNGKEARLGDKVSIEGKENGKE